MKKILFFKYFVFKVETRTEINYHITDPFGTVIHSEIGKTTGYYEINKNNFSVDAINSVGILNLQSWFNLG